MDKQLRNKLFFWFCKYLFQVRHLSVIKYPAVAQPERLDLNTNKRLAHPITNTVGYFICWISLSLFGLYAAILYSKPLSVYAFDVNNRSSAAPVARLEDWRFSPDTSQLEISLSAASQPRYFYLTQPSRIVVDLPGTKLGKIPTKQNFYGAIRSIRVSQLNADVTRIVMDLAPGTFIAPNQVQLQPVSRKNRNRWVLRPLVASNGNSLPQGYLSPLPGNPSNFSPTTITPPLPSNTPPGIYNPPQSPGNLPSATYNSPQPRSHSPLGIYNPPQPSNHPSMSVYNPPQSPGSLQPGIYNNHSQPLGNLPSATYNSPQLPGNSPSRMHNHYPQSPGNLPSATYNQQQVPDFSVPPPLTTLPATSNNFPQAPSVQVPPLSPNNSSQLPSSTFPTPSFPYQHSNTNNSVPAVGTPNFPAPSVPSAPPSSPNSRVIEFGEPFPNSAR
ncbi:MAG: AMIN domain-containing protein [Scytonema sp. RU_4_4]|nr:AMIN domain-containing protein [Scytonema sp. RU_4_4]NJR75168.1 AMIN domain-containing protein [Scytonema sp. CRU_2_7]